MLTSNNNAGKIVFDMPGSELHGSDLFIFKSCIVEISLIEQQVRFE